MTDQGGTVRYHKVDYHPDSDDYPWTVTFVEGESIHEFTAAEGEAMGLVPPEPCATITTPDGRSVDVPMTVLTMFTNRVATNRATFVPESRKLGDALRPLFTDSDGSQG